MARSSFAGSSTIQRLTASRSLPADRPAPVGCCLPTRPGPVGPGFLIGADVKRASVGDPAYRMKGRNRHHALIQNPAIGRDGIFHRCLAVNFHGPRWRMMASRCLLRPMGRHAPCDKTDFSPPGIAPFACLKHSLLLGVCALCQRCRHPTAFSDALELSDGGAAGSAGLWMIPRDENAWRGWSAPARRIGSGVLLFLALRYEGVFLFRNQALWT